MTQKKKNKNKNMGLVKVNTQSLSAEGLMNTAIQKGVTVDVMERLISMRRELKVEKSKEAYDYAMAQFQAECPTIKKSKPVKNKDGTKRYAYAPIEFIVEQVKSIIQKYGFSYTIDALVEDKWVTAICKITHQLGHSEQSSFKIPIDNEAFMNSPQKFASALTFAKRYAFCNVFGILTGDDDDNVQSIKEPSKIQKSVDRKPTIEETIAGIRTSKDKAALTKAIGGITTSKNYTQVQKNLLLTAIEERITELK